MNEDDFNLSDYGIEESTKEPSKAQPKAQPKSKNDTKDEFRLEDYTGSTEAKPERIYGMSREEYDALGYFEKNRVKGRSELKGIGKGILRGASAGFPAAYGLAGMALNKVVPFMEEEEGEGGAFLGESLGEAALLAAPFGWASKAVSTIPKAYKWGTRIAKTAASATLGAGIETAKEFAKGQDLDPLAIGLSGAIFGGGDVVIRTAIRYAPPIYNWLTGLKPSQKAQMLVEGAIPSDMSPTQLKTFREKVVPTLQKVGEDEMAAAILKRTQEADATFKRKMAEARTNHEEYLYNKAKQGKLTEELNQQAKIKFDHEKSTFIAQHQAEMEAIDAANAQAKAAFEESNREFQTAMRRQDIVNNAIKNVPPPPETPAEDLYGRAYYANYFRPKGEEKAAFRGAKKEGKNLVNNPPLPEAATALQEEVGAVVSPKRIRNPTYAGKRNLAAVRATDEADYAITKEWYKYAKDLNKGISDEHPKLVNDLTKISNKLSELGHPSEPQKKAIKAIDDIFDKLHTKDEFGLINGFREMSNETLLEQAKALRYYKDYEFAHGNTGAIFNPIIEALENAAEKAATSAGNTAAVEANQIARNEYRKWADVFDNDFIRQYRSKEADPTKLFEKSLNIDDYNKLDKVLSRTTAGQEVSRETRRALVEKELKPFFKNRGKVDPTEFNEALERLAPILEPEEENFIRGAFAQERRTPVIQGKKQKLPEQPKEPKLKSIDRVDNVPIYKKPKSDIEQITHVDIPLRGPLKTTPAMKTAMKKMKITENEVIKQSSTPQGLRELKQDLLKKDHGQKVFEELGYEKVREILYGGKVQQKFTGKELHNRLNKSNNFDMISEIMGEEAALDMLESAAAIGQEEFTTASLKKYSKKLGTVKAAMLFGIL
jgi:hypothetical protein